MSETQLQTKRPILGSEARAAAGRAAADAWQASPRERQVTPYDELWARPHRP
jgi:hypothetical protein